MISLIISKIIDIYSLLIVVYVIMTWFPTMSGGILKAFDFLEKICEPFLKLFRNLIPPIGGRVDITPIIAIIALELVARLVLIIGI